MLNSFDKFSLTGANIARYLPIYGDAKGIIGAYRKYAEPHKKREPSPLGIGQVPLFLIDGELSPRLLKRAAERLCLTKYVALYRPFDVGIKKRLNKIFAGLRKCGRIEKDGAIAEWLKEDIRKCKASDNEDAKTYAIEAVKEILEYEKLQDEYTAAKAMPPIDAATGEAITGDINEYLYKRAKVMFPVGVESILETNLKQSMIPKHKFFVDGLENAPPPKGVRYSRGDRQLTFFDVGKADIDDTITEIHKYLKCCIEQTGAITLPAIITHCAEIGLYKGNIALYAIGAALRGFIDDNAIFYDGVAYWRYKEVVDISSWILRTYGRISHDKAHIDRFEYKAAIFYDETRLKERLEKAFDLETTADKRLDTLGTTIVQISTWIVDNLRYPIAFLDGTLQKMLSGSSKGLETALYGKTLHEYDAYFTAERCEWIKTHLPHADTIARRLIKEAVGFDPDTTVHGMSGLPKGHYAPVLYSAESYIKEMLKNQRIAV